ncbi:MAG: FxLYD domain-containing protein [Candidatus Bathyarchaeia archaeon]|jgi:hypothetical protein
MKKTILSSIFLLTILSFSLALIPSAESATSDIKILDFSYYLDDSGILWVVGEVQNQGQQIIRYVLLSATATQGDGTVVDPATGQAWAKYLLPNQKAPFAFPIDNTNTAAGTWTGIPIKSIDISVTQADATPLYQYGDVKVTNSTYSVDPYGTYWVSGQLQNTGSETATGVVVVASFYNASGIIVAACELEADSSTLPAGATTTFKLNAIDLNTTTTSPNRRIESYSLSVQVLGPLETGAIPAVSEPTINSGPAPTPIESNSGSTGGDASNNTWIIIAVVVVVVVLGAVLALRMHKPKTAVASKQVLSKKQQKKAEKNAKR